MEICFIAAVAFYAFGAAQIGLLAGVVLLLCVSAMISASETAFFSLGPNRIDQLKSSKSRTSATILRLLDAPEYLLATLLIVNTLINICVVLLSSLLIDSWIDFGSAALELIVKLVAITFILLLFGEIMPKIYASCNPLPITRLMAAPLALLERMLKPFSWLLIRCGNAIGMRATKHKVNISMDELSDVLEMTSDQSAEEKKILTGIVDFVHTEVLQIMKPRIDIVALDIGEDFDRVREVILSSGFSRLPVYEESVDNIKGVLFVKDLIPHIGREAGFAWQPLCRKAFFVPEHKKINDLLEEFQASKTHIAIVVDEYGSTQGLVSLEDILEEVVGEISDESDVEQASYTRIDDTTFLFDAKTHLGEMLKALSLEDAYLDEVKGEAESVGGLMMEVRKDFLRQGEEITVRDLTLRAENVSGHRIDKVLVTLNKNK